MEGGRVPGRLVLPAKSIGDNLFISSRYEAVP